MKYLSSFLAWLRKALFPYKCLVCRKEGVVLCDLHANLQPAILPPLTKFKSLDGLCAVSNYNDPGTKGLVKWLKFHRHRAPVATMAEYLQEQVPWQQWPRATIIPLPLHWWRQHQRGFNQSILLAQAVAEFLQAPYDETSFKRTKLTRQQARLSKLERRQNMSNAFAWTAKATPPETIILLDDVCTTGETLQAAAKALKKAGTKKVIGVVFAYQGLN